MTKHETYIDKNKWKKERLKSIAKKAITLVLLIFASNFIIEKTFHYNFLSNTMKAIVGLANEREDVPSIEIVSSGWETQEVGAWRVTKTSSWDEEANANIVLDVESISKISTIKKDIVLVLDNSYSMKGTKLDNLKSNTIDLVHNVLEYVGNKIAIINFNRNSDILSDFTTDERVLTDIIQKLEPVGTTNYNAALKNVDKLLETYQHEEDKDLIVLFLSDGYPCEDTPNQIATYQMLKEKYDFLALNAVQYEMGDKIQPELIEVSDKQYLATEANLGSVLYKAIDSSDYYEEFVITDLINGEDFYIDSESDIKATLGTFQLVKEDGVQKVIWDLGENAYKTGTTERMTIHLSFVKKKLDESYLATDEWFDGYEGKSYATNLSTNVKSKFNGEEQEDVNTDESPLIPATYYVFYDQGTWNVEDSGRIAEEHFVGEVVTMREYPKNWYDSWDKRKLIGWGIPSGITKINKNQFIMPNKDVYIDAVYKKVNITKSMDGKVYDNDKYLYEAIKTEAFLGNQVKKYEGEGVNDLAKGIYYYTSQNLSSNKKNYVVFADKCWEIIRTTETGGIKLLYHGTFNNSYTMCDNSSKGFEYNIYNDLDNSSISSVGYMYNDNISLVEEENKYYDRDSYEFYSSALVPKSLYLSKEIKYNEEGEYELINPQWGEDLDDIKGYYACSSGDTHCQDGKVYYIVSASYSSYYSSYQSYVMELEGGNYLDDIDDFVVGTDYEKNEDGTYRLLNEKIIKKSEWYDNYNYETPDYFICADESCSSLYHTYNSYYYYINVYKADKFEHRFANSFEYDNDSKMYKLVDYKKYHELKGDLRYNHYFCLDNELECSQLRYIITDYNDYITYLTLENGETPKDIIEKNLKDNTKDSEAKKFLDEWYRNNLEGTIYEKYLEDTIFCNDRSISDWGAFEPNGGELSRTITFSANNREPSLMCKNETDRFSTTNEKAKLKYPIGMLTLDEALLGDRMIISDWIFYMTPLNYTYNRSAYIGASGYNKIFEETSPKANYKYIIPVISLKPGIKYTAGNGAVRNPYILDTN